MSRLFPELEGRRPRETPAPLTADPTDHVIVGGRRSLRAFGRMFAFPPPSEAAVRSLTLDPQDGIRVTVGADTTFWIHPRGRSPVYRETAHLALTYRGSDLTARQAALLDWAARALAPLRFDELERVIRQDPGSIRPLEVEAAAGAPRSAPGRALSPLVYGYGAEETWVSFFADNELERSGSARLLGKHVQVLHTEIECLFGSIPNDDGGLPFFALTQTEGRTSADTGSRTLFTDLGDLDVIKGGTARLDGLMDTIADGEAPDLVTVGTSCTPLVIGDDVEGAIGRLQQRVSAPVMYLGNSINPVVRLIQAWGAACAVRAETPPRESGSVDVVGLPSLPGRASLLALLRDASIEVRTALLPDVDPTMLGRFGEASVQVYFRTDHHVAAYDALRAARPGPAIAPPVPFGVAGTERWLQAIGAATGREAEAERAWGMAWDRLRGRWQCATERAGRYRLGFVLDRHGLTRLERSCRMTGAPLLALLVEMGFGLDLLVHDPDGAGAPIAEVAKRLAAVDARIDAFRTAEELDAALRESRAHAIYTELTMDPRPGRAGKARFSPRDVALGLDGAVQAAERLVALCRMSFFRTYSAHLGGGE